MFRQPFAHPRIARITEVHPTPKRAPLAGRTKRPHLIGTARIINRSFFRKWLLEKQLRLGTRQKQCVPILPKPATAAAQFTSGRGCRNLAPQFLIQNGELRDDRPIPLSFDGRARHDSKVNHGRLGLNLVQLVESPFTRSWADGHGMLPVAGSREVRIPEGPRSALLGPGVVHLAAAGL